MNCAVDSLPFLLFCLNFWLDAELYFVASILARCDDNNVKHQYILGIFLSLMAKLTFNYCFNHFNSIRNLLFYNYEVKYLSTLTYRIPSWLLNV